MEKSKERLKVIERYESMERLGIFDKDAEDDPEQTRNIEPGEVDYLGKKLKTRIITSLTIRKGYKFLKNLENSGKLIIKEIKGLENLEKIGKNQGLIVTCNHFNPLDNLMINEALLPILKHKKIYKVIREGNYTNPPPGFEMFMKHGATLPLSENKVVLKEFLNAISELLERGEKILIYPEQSMWWNYRKPKPLKSGAFNFAVRSSVPVLPVFITMEDMDTLDDDGFPVQAHTIFINEPIYPKAELSSRENIEYLKNENAKIWKEIYEKFYGLPLEYSCDEQALEK